MQTIIGEGAGLGRRALPIAPIMTTHAPVNSFRALPDETGHFGQFGGRYVAETLMPLILDLEKEYRKAQQDPAFWAQFDALMKDFVGRPSPLYFAPRMTDYFRAKAPVGPNGEKRGPKIYFKREELNHTGAHKINNCIGQILLAIRMGKTKIIAETGAGQHGVATATVAARFGLPCKIFMGAKDIERQKPNVFRMKLLGAEVVSCESGSQSLKDSMNDALRHWVANVHDTFYIIGTAAGPHPYPELVRDFQSIIGKETREQMLEKEGRLPDMLVAPVGGGSNAIGLFHPFLDDPEVAMTGIEAGGHGVDTDKHAASLTGGKPGILHGNKTYLLQDEDGQITEAHSISAGLDYPGLGPEHSWLHESGRVKYVPINDDQALEAFQLCCELEGIIPALESAHALAALPQLTAQMDEDKLLVVNLSGRGDKDIFTVAEALGVEL